ncbi:serine hydrolase domain-containing protein [Tunicatimonas pelagia]|uniref:serine hydrolase domain-containing protein n=1 Tax=Tunicatimonas pelagia TaxID=931531 RepID=UPI00266691AC|nr:serine hydrolase [Tunicatimonas pelagia]WKN46264.1 serine hydrolase [Tunicatimonas pelagia]
MIRIVRWSESLYSSGAVYGHTTTYQSPLPPFAKGEYASPPFLKGARGIYSVVLQLLLIYRLSLRYIRYKHLTYFVGIIIILSSCSPPQPQENATETTPATSEMIFPDEDWQTATPESQGIDAEKLEESVQYLADHCFDDKVEELMIIRNGYVIYQGDSIDKVHNIWSCSKSFTSTALGLMIEDGLCQLDDKAATHEPLLTELYPEVTLRQFATMTSGYNAVGDTRWEGDSSADWSWTPYQPGEPNFAPGTAYAYWDEAMMMKGRTLTQILQSDLHEYLTQNLTEPIGMGKWSWGQEGELNGIPIRNGCTNVHVSARQLARVGHLFLNKGNWNGQQVVPEEWAMAAIQTQVPASIPVADTDRKSANGSGSYGYNWWTNGMTDEGRFMPDSPEGTAYMSGLNHNVCFVIPEWDMVYVRMGVDGNPPEGKHVIHNEFIKRLEQAFL